MNDTYTDMRAALEERRAELTERVERIKARMSAGLPADSEERATELENEEVLDALGNEGAEELRNVSAALQRLDDGSYGDCMSCGSEIDRRRLQARPEASRCIVCASSNA